MEKDVILEGKIKGKKEDIIEELEEKGSLTYYQRLLINRENDLDTLRKWIRAVYKTETIDEFFKENLNNYWQNRNAIDTAIEEVLITIVENMRDSGIRVETISAATGLSLKEILELVIT